MKQYQLSVIGWFACALAVGMFLSYVDQIRLNLSGRPGSVVLPAATVLNCLAWVAYGFFRTPRDFPIVVCNSVGVVAGSVTLITALPII